MQDRDRSGCLQPERESPVSVNDRDRSGCLQPEREAPAPRLGRLKRRPEFVRAARAGRKGARDSLVVQALARTDTETRLGFTATKKIGNAVARNRAKRRLRAAARLHLGAAPPPGWDLVLIARDTTGSCPFPTLLADLDGALRKAGVPLP